MSDALRPDLHQPGAPPLLAKALSMRLLLTAALAIASLAGCARSPAPNDEMSQNRYSGSSIPDNASCRKADDVGGDASIVNNIATGAGGSVLANELSNDGSRSVLGYEPPNGC